MEMKKHFYKTHIEDLKKEFVQVKAMGPAAAEEWVKGLEALGKDHLSDAARWEQWEAKGGLRKVNSRPAPRTTAPQTLHTNPSSTSSPVVNVPVNDIHSEHSTPVSINNNLDVSGHRFSPAPTIHTTGTPLTSRGYRKSNLSSFHLRRLVRWFSNICPIATAPPSRFSISPLHNGHPYHPQNVPQQPRMERNIRDVNEAKANRRAEIERRCMEFNPPLLPNVLNHMESFQAAIQISTALTDSAWEVLKPRLLAQRDIAERREHDRFVQSQLFQVKAEERRQQELQSKESKEALDREWDDVQAPVRDRIALYADEIIRDKWLGGQTVTKDNCSRFAADVLLYVRERFYADIAQEDSASRAAGHAIKLDQADRPPTRKLILENMKWVFDSKIKPLTEHFQKELFLCNGCDNNFKFYGFEGVIQHYAAKHTNSLSMGSVVVHWRAEWPEQPPFHPNPSSAKAAFYAIPTPAGGSVHAHPTMPPQALQLPNGYGGYVPPTEQGPQITQPSHGYTQFSPGPYGRPAYPGQYPQNQHGPFPPPPPPPQGFSGFVPGFQGQNLGYPQGPPGRPGFHDPHIGYSGPSNGYEGYPGTYQGQGPQVYGSPFPGHAYLPSNQMPEQMIHQGYGPVHVPYVQPAASAPGLPHPPVGWAPDGPKHLQSSQPTDLYQIQMDEMAKNARGVWNGTSSIKDLPGSVRIYVIIFHVVSRFKAKYTNEPSLAMFSDGLAKNALMRPIKNLNGLACKTCVTSGNGPGAAFHSHPHPPIGDRKLYALPSLLTHFQSVHIERAKFASHYQAGVETSRLDWKNDMVELPEPSLIAGLLHASGMDDTKLQLLASVFPAVFPSPLPRLGPGGNTGPIPIIKEEYDPSADVKAFERVPAVATHDSSPYRPPPKSTGSLQNAPASLPRHASERSADPYVQSLEPSSAKSPRASEPPGEDEYDPHRPAYLEPLTSHYARPQYRRTADLQLVAKDDRDRIRHYSDSPHYRIDDIHPPHSGLRAVRSNHVTYLSSQEKYANRSGNGTESPGSSQSLHRPIVQRVTTASEKRPSDDVLPARSGNHVEERQRPDMVDQGSEDGEIGEAPAPTQARMRSVSPAEEITDAERFLNEFLPGQRVEDYSRKTAEVDSRQEDGAKAKWLEEHGLDGHPRRVIDEGFETRSWRSDGGLGETGENSVNATPIRNGQPPPRSGHGKSPRSKLGHHVQYQDRFESPYDRSPAPRGRLVEHSPELVYPRDVRNTVIYHENRQSVDNLGRRPRSRYDRYEAQRQEQYRTRSRSPEPLENAPLEVAYYRARSPTGPVRQESTYHTYSPPLPREQAPMKEQVTYTRIPAHSQYRYVEDERPYRGAYGEAVEYVPVRLSARGPQSEEPYVLQQPREIAQAGYVRYERGHHGDPIYEHNGQLYRADPRPYEDQDPRAPPLQGRHLR